MVDNNDLASPSSHLPPFPQDYRSEVGEVLAGDPQLAEEITFDLKRFDEEQKRAAVPTLPTSTHVHTNDSCFTFLN